MCDRLLVHEHAHSNNHHFVYFDDKFNMKLGLSLTKVPKSARAKSGSKCDISLESISIEHCVQVTSNFPATSQFNFRSAVHNGVLSFRLHQLRSAEPLASV